MLKVELLMIAAMCGVTLYNLLLLQMLRAKSSALIASEERLQELLLRIRLGSVKRRK